jgi:broad specificity phosphatase PhoE
VAAELAGGSELWVVRHGETEWSRNGRHTSTTDLDLTDEGVEVARGLAGRLEEAVGDGAFDLVLSSPRLRAVRTAELAGFAEVETTEDLAEWDYGDYEGLTTPEIRESVPDWTVWSHPCPGGETAEAVAQRLDRVVERVRAAGGRAIVFSHGHASRVLAARWLGLGPQDGRHFVLGTATLSTLGWERESPAVARWNA